MAVDGVTSNTTAYRDYLGEYVKSGGTASAEKTGQTYNAVFADNKDMGVSVDDFLALMVAQLTNQDFMNPTDDTQYVTQLAQFASMQSMKEMSAYMKTNYVLSLIGQNVTAAKFTVAGDLQKETGAIERISLVDNEYAVYVNGTKFSLEQIMEYHTGKTADASTVTNDKSEKAISEMTLDEIWDYYQDRIDALKQAEKPDSVKESDEAEETDSAEGTGDLPPEDTQP